MFRVENYKITFDKQWHDFSVVNNIDGSLMQKSGRHNTRCHITHGNMISPTWIGKANLHPNDKVDKITGKKIALRNAMIKRWKVKVLPNDEKIRIPVYHHEFYQKSKRTKIWKAFWAWTESWKMQDILITNICDSIDDATNILNSPTGKKIIAEKINRDPKLDAKQI